MEEELKLTIPVGDKSVNITHLEFTEEGDVIVEYDETDIPLEGIQNALLALIEAAVNDALSSQENLA